MRVGLDGQVFAWGYKSGLYNHLASLIEAMDAHPGVDLTVYLRHDAHWLRSMARAREAVGWWPRIGVRRFDVPWPPYQLRRRYSSLNRQEVFLFLADHAAPTAPDCARVFVVADLIPFHMPDAVPAAHREFWTTYYDAATQRADRIVTYSEYVRDDLIATFGVEPDRVVAVPLAPHDRFRRHLGAAELARCLARWGLERERYVLSVGTLEPRKNHALLLEAFAIARRQGRVPRELKLVFAGVKGWLYGPVEEQVRRHHLSDAVVFLGHADPLQALYQGCGVMVFPSRAEGFGLPPLEAMAAGAPVISSNATSLPEVVGDAAILIDPDDAEGLAAALERVFDDPETRSTLVARSRARADLFSWARTAEGYLRVMSEARHRGSTVRSG